MARERNVADMGHESLIEQVLRTRGDEYPRGTLEAMTNEQLLALIPSPGELEQFEPMLPTHGDKERRLPHRRNAPYSRPP